MDIRGDPPARFRPAGLSRLWLEVSEIWGGEFPTGANLVELPLSIKSGGGFEEHTIQGLDGQAIEWRPYDVLRRNL